METLKSLNQNSFYNKTDADSYDTKISDYFFGYDITLDVVCLELLKRNLLYRENSNIENLLELGIGTGNLTKKIISSSIKIDNFFAIDTSEDMFNVAQTKIDKNINFYKDNFKNLIKNFSENYFDFIISSFAIHHLDDNEKQELIKNAFKLLKKKGTLIIADKVEEKTNWETPFAINFLKKSNQVVDINNINNFIQMINKRSEEEEDKPSTLKQHTEWFYNAGFKNVENPCKLYAHIVVAGSKQS